jgi:hypothetical protein
MRMNESRNRTAAPAAWLASEMWSTSRGTGLSGELTTVAPTSVTKVGLPARSPLKSKMMQGTLVCARIWLSILRASRVFPEPVPPIRATCGDPLPFMSHVAGRPDRSSVPGSPRRTDTGTAIAVGTS